MRSLAIGAWGEEFLQDYLVRKGYTVRAMNYHSNYGEIDIIAERDEVLCFIEVKTRKKGTSVSGEYAISKAKQNKIIKTALLYLQEKPSEKELRFDVAVLTHEDGKISNVDYYKAAFDGAAYEE